MIYTVRADKATAVVRMDAEQVAAQMRTIISAGYEPVSATIAVGSLNFSQNLTESVF
jgi:cytochrome P450